MELIEYETLRNMLNNVYFVCVTYYYHINFIEVVYNWVITLQNKKKQSNKYSTQKVNFVNRLKYAEKKICIFIDVCRIIECDDFKKNILMFYQYLKITNRIFKKITLQNTKTWLKTLNEIIIPEQREVYAKYEIMS